MLISAVVFIPFLLAPAAYVLGLRDDKARDLFVIGVSFLELVLALVLFFRGAPPLDLNGIFYTGVHFETGGFRRTYALITALMWAGTSLFAREYFLEEREGLARYWLFVLMTLGATEGVMLSADLMTTFIFFEILSFTSFTWVIHEETPSAIRAGYTYLFIAVIGGLVLFMGLVMLQFTAGTLFYDELAAAVAGADRTLLLAAGTCILFGFGAKAGMFPLHVWLPKAHPIAPSPASALLSGILTKVGVYGILMTALTALAGESAFGLLVLLLGVITMALGALMALFSINLKRTLACSSMSQIGFILTGVGMYVLLNAAGETEGAQMALSGAMLHMVNHSLIKLTLFMCAGVVVMNIHSLDLNRIRGYGRGRKAFMAAFGLGALGISGVPLFNGYISKTMLHEGIVEGIHALPGLSVLLGRIEWVFLISGGFTFAYMLKLFICLFVEENGSRKRQRAMDRKKTCMDRASLTAVCGSSVFMVLLGQPAVMVSLSAFMTGDAERLPFHAFAWESLRGGLISLTIGGLVYLVIVRRFLMKDGRYVDRWFRRFDLEDSVYRPLLTGLLPDVMGAAAALFGENMLLAPDARVFFLLWSILARALCSSVDALVVLLRKTLVREVPVRRSYRGGTDRLQALAHRTERAAEPLLMNFSFALLMTCIGILLILGVLLFFILRG